VSSGGGDQPGWRADGKALYYMNANRMLTEVEVKSFTPLTLGAQHPLFRLAIPTVSLTGPRTFYAVTRNGEKFIVAEPVGEEDDDLYDTTLRLTALIPAPAEGARRPGLRRSRAAKSPAAGQCRAGSSRKRHPGTRRPGASTAQPRRRSEDTRPD